MDLIDTPFYKAGLRVGWDGPRNMPVPTKEQASAFYNKLTTSKASMEDVETVIRYHRKMVLPTPTTQEAFSIIEEAYEWCSKYLDHPRAKIEGKRHTSQGLGVGYNNYRPA